VQFVAGCREVGGKARGRFAQTDTARASKPDDRAQDRTRGIGFAMPSGGGLIIGALVMPRWLLGDEAEGGFATLDDIPRHRAVLQEIPDDPVIRDFFPRPGSRYETSL
jgi:hypothetical protein